MFANRYTAFIDACSLAGVLKRNLLLTLAETGFYRVRWSQQVLDETEKAIKSMMERRNIEDAEKRSQASIFAMTEAFDDAMVSEFDSFLCVADKLPDPGDAHVLAAAIKTRAHIIVTDNIKHFPSEILGPLNIEAATTDDFLANTITLNTAKAVGAIKTMRERFKRPEKSAEDMFLDMEASGLTSTVDVLRPYEDSL
ncbi:MAG TPA: PIN domain-containing protein [Hyphomicrobiaceae bacterium]|nr:PIN domain-containing protein [Hyphomicrobiaceae bacterium]